MQSHAIIAGKAAEGRQGIEQDYEWEFTEIST